MLVFLIREIPPKCSHVYYICTILFVLVLCGFFLLDPRVLVITLRVWYACVRGVIQYLHTDSIVLLRVIDA